MQFAAVAPGIEDAGRIDQPTLRLLQAQWHTVRAHVSSWRWRAPPDRR